MRHPEQPLLNEFQELGFPEDVSRRFTSFVGTGISESIFLLRTPLMLISYFGPYSLLDIGWKCQTNNISLKRPLAERG